MVKRVPRLDQAVTVETAIDGGVSGKWVNALSCELSANSPVASRNAHNSGAAFELRMQFCRRSSQRRN
jgi:hypothetical protein